MSTRLRVACAGWLLSLVGGVVLTGCASSPPSSTGRFDADVTPGLVLPTTLALESAGDGAGWESSRRDAALGVDKSSKVRERHWVEISTYERQSTINGRIHETSRTRTRTLRRRSGSSG